jgi:flavin-binding protein dodecin
MDDEALNTSIRKFLKLVGVSSQREIEQAIARAMQENAITGNETLDALMTLEVPALKLRVKFDGALHLQ